MRLEKTGDPEIATRISSYEMAFRMQQSAPGVMNIGHEPRHILEMYGAEPGKPSFANTCLLARRLLERGVRFVQIFHESWDQHDSLVRDIKYNCKETDQACAALIKDLKQRGMLEDTLVVWGGEFGRTPMVQGGGNDGRDHHPNAFSMWLAGGGVKPGITYGETDELGFQVVKDKVHVHDLHATLLHLLGFDHTRLTYRFQGRDFRLDRRLRSGGQGIDRVMLGSTAAISMSGLADPVRRGDLAPAGADGLKLLVRQRARTRASPRFLASGRAWSCRRSQCARRGSAGQTPARSPPSSWGRLQGNRIRSFWSRSQYGWT